MSQPTDEYARWLRATHTPAHARRTAERNAAFLLPHLAPGMRLLDAGCGPGSITLGLAAAVAPGEVVGIDAAPEAIDAATAAAAQASQSNARFASGNVYALPFEDGHFDVVFMHAVLQHLNEPVAALGEAFRVLRPGGLVALADADYGGYIIAPRSASLDSAIALQERIRLKSGGDTRIGAKLGSLIAGAGFERVECGATANSAGTAEGAKLTGDFNARYFEAPELAARAAAGGWATKDELAEAGAAWREWGSTPGAFQATFWCHALGRKPG